MRRKQRSHLDRLMESDETELYETTIEDCRFWFNVLNKDIFDNALPRVTNIIVGRRRGTYAIYECCTDDEDDNYFYSTIYMNTHYKSKKFMVEVLCHEMVHHYQTTYGEPLGHGPSFLRWREKLNKKGLNLVRAYSE
jgi:SprT-like family